MSNVNINKINTDTVAKANDAKTNKPIVPKLTKREKEVLLLAFEGKTSQEIATLLVCSKRTVDFHLHKCYGKLNVGNKMQALHRATELGLIRFRKKTSI